MDSRLVYVVVEYDSRLNECGTTVFSNLDYAIDYANETENTVEIRETLMDGDLAYVIITFTKID